MKRKLIRMFGLALCVGIGITGCGDKEKEESKVKEVQEEPEEKLWVIGTEGDNAYVIQFTNASGQKLTGLSVKASGTDEWPENILAGGEVMEDK